MKRISYLFIVFKFDTFKYLKLKSYFKIITMVMDNTYYLTDSIFIQNNKTYYKDKKEVKEVKEHNWHKILSLYGWEKIHKRWITLLNKQNKTRKNRNSLFGVYDCESDGNCFFQCIANALNEKSEHYYDHSDIRNMIADSITEDQYTILMDAYRAMDDANDFDEEWDPHAIQCLDDFKDQLKRSGHNYWCDYLLLQIIINLFQMNIFILTCNTHSNNYSVYNTLQEYNPDYRSIFLIYENECHFQLLGYFDNGLMVSHFHSDNIPHELLKICNIIR